SQRALYDECYRAGADWADDPATPSEDVQHVITWSACEPSGCTVSPPRGRVKVRTRPSRRCSGSRWSSRRRRAGGSMR
ncbi:hypothetical protein AB0M52_29885, partial [Micromonospora sp. NPDC051296]